MAICSISIKSWLCLIVVSPQVNVNIYFEMVAIQQLALLITFTIYSAQKTIASIHIVTIQYKL